MAKRTASGTESPPPRDPNDRAVQVLGVYLVDLLAELEGFLRTLTRMQQQVERLRADSTETPSQRRESLKLLVGNVRTMKAKVETLRDTLPEVEAAVTDIEKTLESGAAGEEG